MIELEDCPRCRGVGILQHEGGWCTYVECLDCGAQTVYAEYRSEDDREAAEQTVARLWNLGKVTSPHPGE